MDARQPLATFTAGLQEQGHLATYPGAYAKDVHFRDHGFTAVNTVDEVAAFLNALDAAPGSDGRVSPCLKAQAIRQSLDTEDTYGWGVVARFALFASGRRRVHCSCHETGSFHPVQPDTY